MRPYEWSYESLLTILVDVSMPIIWNNGKYKQFKLLHNGFYITGLVGLTRVSGSFFVKKNRLWKGAEISKKRLKIVDKMLKRYTF